MRGVRPVKFEGGGCNWSWVDDGFSDEELKKIAARLAYSKLGLGSHKCTSLHGIAASKATLDRIEPLDRGRDEDLAGARSAREPPRARRRS